MLEFEYIEKSNRRETTLITQQTTLNCFLLKSVIIHEINHKETR